MVVEISNKASISNSKNILHLLEEWNLQVAINYEVKVLEALDLISKNPEIGQYEKSVKLRKFLIVPQIYVLYEVYNNKILVIDFWNNYQKNYW